MRLNIKYATIQKIIILLCVLGVLSLLSKQIRIKEENNIKEFNSKSIKKYLLEHNEIIKSSKPLLWIHIPREINARKWENFGSPNSDNLNMPFIYLTIRSIIENCNKSFTICLIDDDSFAKLLPGWEIDLHKINNPILDNVRTLGFLKILYLYGGLLCPNSFLCQRDLIDLYNLSYTNNIVVCFEKLNLGTSHILSNYVPNIRFLASYPQNNTIKELSNYMESLISKDISQESVFLERIGMECEKYVEKQLISKQEGSLIGIKNSNNKDITLDDLLNSSFVNFDNNKYGIFIPLINRHKYEWFLYLNAHEIFNSDTIIGKQLLLTLGEQFLLQNNVQIGSNDLINKNNLSTQDIKHIIDSNVGYWETPLHPSIWGLKPNLLGNNLIKK